MATADQLERDNLVRQSGVVRYLPPKDSGTTNITRDAGPAGAFGPGSQYNFGGAKRSLTDQFTDTQTANIFGKPPMFGGTTPTGPQTGMGNFESMLAGFLGNSGSGAKASDILARDKFNYDKQQDTLTRAEALEALRFGRARDARVTSGYENYYDGGKGAFNTGFDKLLGMITDQGKVSTDAVTDAYGRAIKNMNEGYDTAQGLGDKGYSALNEYLTANPNNPYANINAQVGSAPDALSQYLSAYGVSDAPVQGQIAADQLQAQQGAGNFQNLIDVLSGVAQQGASSREAESQMAQLLFNTGLGQDRAGYRTQAENAQAQALAALQQQMFQSRFGVEGDRNSLANQLAMAVINAGGTLNPGPAKEADKGPDKGPDKEADKGPDKGNGGNTPPPPVYPTFNTDIANMPAVEQRAALDRIESYTPETFRKDVPPAQLAALTQLMQQILPDPPPEVSPQELRRRQIAELVRR